MTKCVFYWITYSYEYFWIRMRKNLLLFFCGAAMLFAGSRGIAALTSDADKGIAKFTSETLFQRESAQATLRNNPGSQVMIPAYIRFNDLGVVERLRGMGVHVGVVGKSVLTADIPVMMLDSVGSLGEVECVQAASAAQLLMDTARLSSRVADVQSATEIENIKVPFTGKGVMVAAIDGGLDFTHPAFYNADRTELRIKRVWIHDAKTGTPPAGFTYGAELRTPEEILAYKTDLNYYSHGSHVMNIAAGNNLSSPYHGIAPEATLAFSNFAEIDKGISDGIQYLFRTADSLHMPAVINMSLGTQMGPHDGSSLRDVLGDELTGEGRILVGASGNDAMVDMHITKTFTADDTQLLAGMAFLESNPGIGELQIWGEKGKPLKVNVCTVDKSTMDYVYKSRTFDCSRTATTTVTLQKPFDMSSGYFKIVTQKSPLNDKPMAHITLNISDYKPDKVIAILITSEAGATVHGWANNNQCIFRKHLANMGEPDHNYGVCEIGGTGKSIITVGSYNTKNFVTTLSGTPQYTEFSVGAISPFSNVGPTADGRMKPDVSAPGSLIVSAFNSSSGNDPAIVYNTEWNGKSYPYGVYQGTSMASPHVAGVIALWLQANRKLTPAQIRQILDHSCKRDSQTGPEANNTWGRGKIDAYNGLVYLLRTFGSTMDVAEAVGETSWSANIIDGSLHVLYYREVRDAAISVYNVAGQKVHGISGKARAMGDETILDLRHLPTGIYLVQVSGGGMSETVKIRN